MSPERSIFGEKQTSRLRPKTTFMTQTGLLAGLRCTCGQRFSLNFATTADQWFQISWCDAFIHGLCRLYELGPGSISNSYAAENTFGATKSNNKAEPPRVFARASGRRPQ